MQKSQVLWYFNPNPNKIYYVFYMLDAASLIDSISKCPKFTMS